MPVHFLSSDDLRAEEQTALISRARELKATRRSHVRPLEGRSVGMLFEKPSTRTRVSFEVAVSEMGGHTVTLRADELQLGRGEAIGDTAIVLSRYLDAVVIRTFGRDRLDEFASASSIAVINALTDYEHPCQALADVMTINEKHPDATSVRVAYLGDGNNVCHSLLIAGAKAGFGEIAVASPPGYEPTDSVVARAEEIGASSGTRISVGDDPVAAAKGATVLYTDVWASMGQESERSARLAAFKGFAIDADRLSDASPGAIVMHCLPAHRGEEIASEVLDAESSVVWDQAENRLHTQKALLEYLITR